MTGPTASGRPAAAGDLRVRWPRAAILGAVDRIVVNPGGPLSGTVRAGGAKNSVLKLMAACLLAEGATS